MRYEIEKHITCECAHIICGHKDPVTGDPGKCSRLHGHSYRISVVLTAEKTSEIGFTIDYYWLGLFLKRIYEKWDHQYLNDFREFWPPFNASAERMAQVVFEEAEHFFQFEAGPSLAMQETKGEVSYVLVKETESTYAKYGRV